MNKNLENTLHKLGTVYDYNEFGYKNKLCKTAYNTA